MYYKLFVTDIFRLKKTVSQLYGNSPLIVRLIGIEPMTYRLGGGRSILLSYKRKSTITNNHISIKTYAIKVNTNNGASARFQIKNLIYRLLLLVIMEVALGSNRK